ncbi:MAG: M28 family peptidase [Candidatus Acidiferrales bacterium]|jgi:hypothetical protein
MILISAVACGRGATPSAASVAASQASSASAPPAQISSDAPPPAAQTGGFDGAAAYDFTAKLVAFGPRPPGSDAIHHTQDYIIAQLKSFGCAVDTDDFTAQTPIGALEMKNIVAKLPGTGQGIILLLTHYDTLRAYDFVGAEDGGSSSGLMLEMARLLCRGEKRPNAVWIAFLDGEEAQVEWSDTDSVYGSRELAARLAVAGDLKRVRAVVLADMIGQKNLQIERDSSSTKWLTNLVWSTAARLGYKDIFVSQETSIDDDHRPFLTRDVPAVDIIDLEGYRAEGYWHTPQDTMDKLSPRSLAIVGHVILESVNQLVSR